MNSCMGGCLNGYMDGLMDGWVIEGETVGLVIDR